MFTSSEKTIIEDIIEHFGHTSQLVKSVEEAGEYITAVTRYLSLKDENGTLKEHAIEEVADALIMLSQVRIILGADDVDEVISFKLGRTMDRIKTEEKINART